MSLGKLRASLLGKMLTEREVIRITFKRAGDVIIKTSYRPKKSSNKQGFLIPPLTNLKIYRYYQNELRFNEFYLRDNPPDKIKDREYVINFDDYVDIGVHWIDLYSMKLHSNDNTITYFDSFGVKHILKKVKKLINRIALKGFTNARNISRIQAFDSIICGYFYIEFIDFMLKDEKLTGFSNLFSPNNYKDIDKIILKYIYKLMKCLECIQI